MARCPHRCEEIPLDEAPNRPSRIPRPDVSQNLAALPPTRGRFPCPYPGSRIPTRVPPYSGQPLYLPEGNAAEWPGMRANFAQEVRNFPHDPDFFREDRPPMHSVLVTGNARAGRMRLQRSNQPDMSVNQPIPERVRRMRTPAPQAPQAPQASRVQPRYQPPQAPRGQSRQTPRAISAGPPVQQERSMGPRMPAVQPVRSTGAIPRVPGVAMRVPTRSPPTPGDYERQRPAPRRPPAASRAPPLDAAALRARQQAQALGVSQQRPSRPTPRHDEYVGDFELMERVAQQEQATGVSARRPPSGSYYRPEDSFDEFEQMERAFDKIYAPSGRVPYTSPEGLREFEQLERETMRPPVGQSGLPRPMASQGATLDEAQIRARQQARSLGVSRQAPRRAGSPRNIEEMGEFELMERVAQQEQELGVRSRAPPSNRVPYTSPEGQREFEQLERETHLEAVAAPVNLQNLLVMPSVHLEVQPIAEQGPRSPPELWQYMQRQYAINAAIYPEGQRQSPAGSSSPDESSHQWCPPQCGGVKK